MGRTHSALRSILSIPWILRCADELENIGAAFDWSIDHDDVGQAATLLVSTAGATHMLVGNAQGYRWTQTLLERDVHEPARVAVLAAGVIAAVGVGDHAAMEV